MFVNSSSRTCIVLVMRAVATASFQKSSRSAVVCATSSSGVGGREQPREMMISSTRGEMRRIKVPLEGKAAPKHNVGRMQPKPLRRCASEGETVWPGTPLQESDDTRRADSNLPPNALRGRRDAAVPPAGLWSQRDVQ